MAAETSARPASSGAGAARSASRVTGADVRAQIGDIRLDGDAVALVAVYLSQHEDPEGVDVEAAYEFAVHAGVHGPSATAFLLDLGAYDIGTAVTVRELARWLQAAADDAGCGLDGCDCHLFAHPASP